MRLARFGSLCRCEEELVSASSGAAVSPPRHPELLCTDENRHSTARIDPVHYCELEEILSSKRRRRSRHDEEDVPAVRLHLLANTIRGNDWIGSQVQFLKLPYMTREVCRADLARAVAGCPNLRYVDLPEDFYTGDPNCNLLRQELQIHCPDLKSMKYHAGSEQFFQQLAQRQWQAIEILDLKELRLDPATLRIVLGFLPLLHQLSLTSISGFTDEIFTDAPQLPPFPPLQTFSISKCPSLTAAGLNRYLEHPHNRKILTTLFLKSTGVTVPDLASLLHSASNLSDLAYIQSVSTSLPLDPLPPLQSGTLQTLHYEITPTDSASLSATPGLLLPTTSYYTYLTQSLLSNTLPALRSLYVRDPSLPDALLLAPPNPSFAASSQQNPFATFQPLEVYTKALDESDWVFQTILPSHDGRPGSSSGSRPLSFLGASRGLGPQWGEARRSVVVGNGFGGFLAVPEAEAPGRPTSSGSGRKGSTGMLEPPGGQNGEGRGFWRKGSADYGKRGSRVDLWR